MPRTVKHKFPNHAWELNPLLVFFGRGQVCHATNLYGQEDNKSQNGPEKKLACRNLAEVFAWTYSNQNICICIHSLKYHYIHMVGWPGKDSQAKPSFPPTYIFDFRKTVPLGHPKKKATNHSHPQPAFLDQWHPTNHLSCFTAGSQKIDAFFHRNLGSVSDPKFFSVRRRGGWLLSPKCVLLAACKTCSTSFLLFMKKWESPIINCSPVASGKETNHQETAVDAGWCQKKQKTLHFRCGEINNCTTAGTHGLVMR